MNYILVHDTRGYFAGRKEPTQSAMWTAKIDKACCFSTPYQAENEMLKIRAESEGLLKSFQFTVRSVAD